MLGMSSIKLHHHVHLKPLRIQSLSRDPDETLTLALTRSLRSLLPILKSPPPIPFSYLSRFLEILALTIAGAAASAASGYESKALSAHLDFTVGLLDACNAASAAIEGIRLRVLRLRYALHLLDRDALAKWAARPGNEIRGGTDDLIRRLGTKDTPRGKGDAVRRATQAVETVGGLVMATVVAVLCGGEGSDPLVGIRASSELPWAEAFDEVKAAVSDRLWKGFSREVEATEAAVRRLTAVIDEGDDGNEERLKSAVSEAEKATGELTAGLDRLADGVNGVFDATMSSRDMALMNLRTGPKRCNQ
ncbi:protein BPS1, chloroplastic-like [Typha angustifolia]|uniref:protein BPS1, chloroplastic-like n=1 Tax=Typha angustifolia TaxID=59011 RepID=UPI003C308F9C